MIKEIQFSNKVSTKLSNKFSKRKKGSKKRGNPTIDQKSM